MSTLTDAQCTAFRHKLHADGLDLMQAEFPHLTKPQLKAAFQAVENFWEANRSVLKSQIDTVVGQSISNALAKKIGKYWLQYKWKGE